MTLQERRGLKLLKKENCCLHVIDPQIKLMNSVHRQEEVLDTIGLMIDCAKILNLPIVANTQYKKGLGAFPDFLEEKLADVPQIDKIHFNCLASEATALYYDNLPTQVTTAILVGAESHICIYQTAVGLFNRSITPWVVSDGVSSRSAMNHKAALKRMNLLGCKIGPAEMIIYELLEKAGTKEFKEILPFILQRKM